MATGSPKKASDLARAAAKTAVDVAAEHIQAKIDLKADKMADKVVQKATKASAKVDTAAAKAARALGEHHHHHAADPLAVWARDEHDRRRPRCTRADIAAAAIRIADSEGLDALSMRRLAAELDVGTMTLYHYIATKDELLTLVFDGLMAEMVLPPGQSLPHGWREALTTIARRSRDTLRRHPWILDITDDPPLGPNSVRHFDQSLQALASLDAPLATKIDILTAVDEYVFGHCLHERNNYGDDGGLPPRLETYLTGLLATGEYPSLAALTADRPLRAVWKEVSSAMRDDRRFDRNLARLLDGVEHSLRPH